jgi:hypothetical protein
MNTQFEVNSNFILRAILTISIFLSITVFFVYRPFSWPFGSEAIGCWFSVILISIGVTYLWKRRDTIINKSQRRNVSFGLCLGLLWTIEISINNFLRPGLPSRDIIDNLFWAVIVLLIIIAAARDTYQSDKIINGVKSGFWTSLASGAVASLTALLIIVFGMKYVLLDPLNQKEWSDIEATVNSPGMAVYFAYETFAGAIMHLFILGAVLGLVLGFLGGLSGKLLRTFKKQLPI